MEPIQDDHRGNIYDLKALHEENVRLNAELASLVAERDRLQTLHDGATVEIAGLTAHRDKAEAERDRLIQALERIAAERNDHLMFTGTHAEDMYAIAHEELTLHGRVTGPPHEHAPQPGGSSPPDEVP
jgi:uncharacterized protein (DUF3084 family)